MLAQKNRFHGHASLKYVYRNGAVSRSRFFVIRAIENTRRQESRCSVVVSKKVLKNAVGRNRIRRRVYHTLHAELGEFLSVQDVVVVVCTSEVALMPYVELKAQLLQQLKDTNVIS